MGAKRHDAVPADPGSSLGRRTGPALPRRHLSTLICLGPSPAPVGHQQERIPTPLRAKGPASLTGAAPFFLLAQRRLVSVPSHIAARLCRLQAGGCISSFCRAWERLRSLLLPLPWPPPKVAFAIPRCGAGWLPAAKQSWVVVVNLFRTASSSSSSSSSSPPPLLRLCLGTVPPRYYRQGGTYAGP